ncbi:hypothetical protein G9A89_009818 [Geosiphon pyriformis]|nr:hypothetical protein G9A89_009818 [Geosiphon pyriformis]
MWNNIPEHRRTCNKTCQYTILINNWVCKRTPIDDRMVYAKTEGATTSELLEIKNNFLSLPEPKYVQTFDVFGNIEDDPKKFYEHYKQLAPTKEEQKQFFNPNSNSNNDDNENTGSSSTQYDNKNNNNLDSNSNPKTYITLPNLTKEQELKWFSDNNKGIMPKHAHDTDVGFDLKYPEKDSIKLEPHLRTCIDLKIALEIPATTMIQLASRNSLAKKRINIRRRIIDTGYVGNIIAML